jgi:hypothetical protein
MKKILWTTVFVTIFAITLITGQSDRIFGKAQNSQKYPIVCKNELGLAPKNMSVEKVDVNSDGLIDLIATYPWGGSALYINCGNGQYYRAIRSGDKLSCYSKDGDWKSIFSYILNDEVFWGVIDNRLYKNKILSFEYEKDGEPLDWEYIIIKHDGISYKPPFTFCKLLGIYAPRYCFDSSVKVVRKSTNQKIKTLYCELTHNIIYQVIVDKQESYGIMEVNFADINQDGALDAFLYYGDKQGSGASTYVALMLNDGSNNFVLSGIINLGYCWKTFPSFRSQTITVNGSRFAGIVFKGPTLRPGEKKLSPKAAVELYLYQPKLKEFMHITAMPGRDQSSFIPLDKKKFEDIVNPPLFRNEPANSGNLTKEIKVDEPAISKLLENYEKSLVTAINRNNFPLVARYLTPGSNLYKSQKNLVAKLYQKKTQEKLVGYKVEKIETAGQADVYHVYVTEKIGIKRSGKTNFVVSEFRWVYTVVADGEKYSLSDIAKWDGK